METSPAEQAVSTELVEGRGAAPPAADAPLPEDVTRSIVADLRVLARRARLSRRSYLETTSLVNEAWLRLAAAGAWPRTTEGHWRALAASVIRSALVDEARREGRAKRGRGWRRIPLEDSEGRGPAIDLVELDDELSALEKVDARRAQVVTLRFFGGLSVRETAGVLGVSERTVEADWRLARAWLRLRLEGVAKR